MRRSSAAQGDALVQLRTCTALSSSVSYGARALETGAAAAVTWESVSARPIHHRSRPAFRPMVQTGVLTATCGTLLDPGVAVGYGSKTVTDLDARLFKIRTMCSSENVARDFRVTRLRVITMKFFGAPLHHCIANVPLFGFDVHVDVCETLVF